jgi:hypothetical protein
MQILGETNEDIAIDSVAENREHTLALAEQARSSLDLFTREMDAALYDSANFERCIFNLARKHRSAVIRILVQDSSTAVSQGHCLIRLAQRLTSSVFIHNPAREHRDRVDSFMIVDNTGMIYRPRSSNRDYQARVNYQAPYAASELRDLFNTMWESSTSDSQVRRLYI